MAIGIPVPQNDQQIEVGPAGGLQAAQAGPGIGAGLEALGGGVDKLADSVQYSQRLMDQAGAKQADTNFNDFIRTTMDTGDNAYYSKRGEDALNAYDGTIKALQDKREEISNGLANDSQRRLFNEVADQRFNEAATGAARHSRQQTQIYEDTASKARQFSAGQDAITYSDDPEKLQNAIGTVRSEALAQAQTQGLHGDVASIFADKAVSDTFDSVVQAKAATDPLTAKRFFDLHRDMIEPDTQIKLDKMLEEPIQDQDADEKSDQIRGMGGANPNPNAGDLIAAVTGQESGGRNGLRSSAGALGVMQVMPKTAQQMCQEMGIAYDPNKLRNDPAYCTKIGTAYLQKMLARYNGNTTLALAAYNAGPGNVDSWIDNIGDPRKGEVTDQQFAAAIPNAETRAYVPGVLRRLGPGSAKNAPQQNDLTSQLANADNLAQAQSWSPALLGKVKEKLISKAGLDERLLGQQQKQAEDQAWNQVLPVDGSAPITDPTKIPPSLWSQMSPAGQRTIREQIKQNAKGEDPPPNPGLYIDLSEKAAKGTLSFDDVRQNAANLPKADFDHFVGLAKSAQSVEQKVNMTMINATVKNAVAAKLPLADKTLPKSQQAAFTQQQNQRRYDFQKALTDDVEVWQQANPGKKLQPTDVQAMADRRLIQTNVGQMDGTHWWTSGTPAAPRYQFEAQPGEPGHVQIPTADYQRLMRKGTRILGRTPSNEEIYGAYMHEARGGL